MIVQKSPNTRAKIAFSLWHNIPRVILFFAIILIFLSIFGIYVKSADIKNDKKNAISQEKPPVNVVTLKLTPAKIYDRINLPGSIEPWVDLQLLAKINGAIEEVLVREGQRVSEGQVLARIEDADYKIALSRAQVAYTLVLKDFERDQAVYRKGVIPIAELDAKKTAMQTAKADLEHAELQYSRCQIRSPMAGVIYKLDAKVGLLLAVGDNVTKIINLDKVKAVIGIPESDVDAVRKIDQVNLSIQALDSKNVVGEKYFLSPVPDSIARLYNFELAIDNSSGDILPGMFVRADIVKKMVDNAISIPLYSVISRNKEQYVFVEHDGLVMKKNVKLGIMEKWMVEVTEGLVAGEHLVVEGHRDVEHQQRVNVVQNYTTIKTLPL